MNQINGSFTNKTNQPTKQKPMHKYGEQLVVTRGDGEAKWVKGLNSMVTDGN